MAVSITFCHGHDGIGAVVGDGVYLGGSGGGFYGKWRFMVVYHSYLDTLVMLHNCCKILLCGGKILLAMMG